MTKNPRFYELLDEMRTTHDNKNDDYATDVDPLSNFRECERFGVPAWKGALVRMSDKWARITRLASGKEPAVAGESIEDTLMDMAVYALIVIMLFEQGRIVWIEKEK